MEVKLVDVNFSYNENTPLEKKVLNNINLVLEKNKIHGIVGRSGSGKTTLIELISILSLPTSGNIHLGSKVINSMRKIDNINLLRKKIGFVFQFPEEQIFSKTVRKEIEFGLSMFSKNEELVDKCVSEAIKMVGLPESFLDLNPFNLSNGEMRKVVLASILASNPRLLILDEPTVGLDNLSKENLISVLRDLKNKHKKTIIIVSHDSDFIHKICDNVVVLSNGEVVLSGNKYDVFTNDSILNYGVTLPKIIEFEKMVIEKKGVKLGYRDDINDLMKDVYRCVK